MNTKKMAFYCFMLLLSSSRILAQNNSSTSLMQTDSTLMHINGEGTFIRLGKGEGTKINFLTAVQSGVQYNQFDSNGIKSNTNRMSLNLVRISITASGYKDKMSMGIMTDLTGTSPILEGWVGLSMFKKRAKFILGQKQTNTNNRLAMSDERYAQYIGQTIAGKSNDGVVYGGLAQNFVGASREGGLFLESNFKINNWKIYPSVSLTTGEGQNFFSSQTNKGLKYGGRLDIMPFGDFINNNAFIAQDIYREKKPKLAIGIAASINKKASSSIGSENATISGIYNLAGVADFADYRKLAADFIFKYNGFSVVGEYMNGNVVGKDLFTNITATNKLTEQSASNYYNLGNAINIQSSYITKNGWSVDGRYTMVQPEFEVDNSLIHPQTWISAGVNKFIKNNSVKIGMNFTHIENQLNATITTKKTLANVGIQIMM